MRNRFILLFLFLGHLVWGTDPYPRNPNIDIKHYKFAISLNDSTNIIKGTAEISILFKQPVSQFSLDLIGESTMGTGMSVNTVQWQGTDLKFSHKMNRLEIEFQGETNQLTDFVIHYEGIPADGLIIGRNKFGNRTFFGDNWPDRARNWLPSIDHPYDKATCEFVVTAPAHYQTIANGELVGTKALSDQRLQAHWKQTEEIPTKVMVIGVAQFEKELAGTVQGIPVETWVYPQNKEAGFYDFKIAPQVLQYFVKQLGDFPFKKLANVQSTTRFGGMENASAIFYFENSVTGKNEIEALIAHEVAHQWFGDSASEADWYHVWLSEGFATYMSALYMKDAHGQSIFREIMTSQRNDVVNYYHENPSPVIDTTVVSIMEVLNTNSYEKGSWILHMLRKKVGDEAFWKGIRTYYENFKYSNALTSDFVKVLEDQTGIALGSFFRQWLYLPGHPQLAGTWAYDNRNHKLTIDIEQMQKHQFEFPLDLDIELADGTTKRIEMQFKGRKSMLKVDLTGNPKTIVLDPEVSLLFEAKILPK